VLKERSAERKKIVREFEARLKEDDGPRSLLSTLEYGAAILEDELWGYAADEDREKFAQFVFARILNLWRNEGVLPVFSYEKARLHRFVEYIDAYEEKLSYLSRLKEHTHRLRYYEEGLRTWISDEAYAVRMEMRVKGISLRSNRDPGPSVKTQKIRWGGPKVVLLYWFRLMHEAGLIDEQQFQNRFEIIADTYCDHRSRSFDKEILREIDRNMRANKKTKGVDGKGAPSDVAALHRLLAKVAEVNMLYRELE
jgi:hypothetical protein